MAMRRGFMAEAKRLADEVRAELGLTPTAPLDPWKLAEHLCVPVLPLSGFQEVAPNACRVLLGSERSAFSALVAFVGSQRVIVQNDAHAMTRQRANIGHELAHILLFHDGRTLDGQWHLTYDADQEDEAKWLGGVLLVTDEACLAGCRRDLTLAEAAAELEVSEDLMRWRRNKSGAVRRVQRERARLGAGPSRLDAGSGSGGQAIGVTLNRAADVSGARAEPP